MTTPIRHSRRRALWLALPVMLTAWAPFAAALASGPQKAPVDLSGVYQAIPADMVLPGGRRNTGSPSDIPLRPAVVEQMKGVDLTRDPSRFCQIVGPFRNMARDRVKVELVQVISNDTIVMLFEDVSRGYLRTIALTREHPEPGTVTWNGDSVGHWEGATLVIDTVGFNDRTWLNDAGAPHSDALHLVERIRPILGGRYLEYRVTADDPSILAKPFTYTRYFEKLHTDIMEDVCEQ